MNATPNLNDLLDYGDKVDALTDDGIREVVVRHRVMKRAMRLYPFAKAKEIHDRVEAFNLGGVRAVMFDERLLPNPRLDLDGEEFLAWAFDAYTKDGVTVEEFRGWLTRTLRGTSGTLLGDAVQTVADNEHAEREMEEQR